MKEAGIYNGEKTVSNHQGNANQNHNEISPPTCQNGYDQEEHK